MNLFILEALLALLVLLVIVGWTMYGPIMQSHRSQEESKEQSDPSDPGESDTARALTAVLLVNLGTPQAPTASAVRRYLAEFLSDPRVVELPRWLWLIVLHGVILRVRPKRSAAKYAKIWRGDVTHPNGSALRHYTERQAALLQAAFLTNGPAGLCVRYAMRYGNPSLASALQALKAQGRMRILVLPLYPQYAASTTASVVDEVGRWLSTQRWQPEVRYIQHYGDDPRYIAALRSVVEAHWQQQARLGHPRAQVLVMSFHGIPERSVRLGDPYHAQCQETARLLAKALGLTPDQYRITFQSRFGPAQWLQPYTEATLVSLAQAGTERVDVMCPGFVADCLETLEEINLEVRHAFLQAGGKHFAYIPCLNDHPSWMDALRGIASQHLCGWVEGAAPASA